MFKCSTKNCKFLIPVNIGVIGFCKYCMEERALSRGLSVGQYISWRDHLRASYNLSVDEFEALVENKMEDVKFATRKKKQHTEEN